MSIRWSEILPDHTLALGDQLEARAQHERGLGKTIYPPQDNIFNALSLTTPDKLKVCIVGQDPYHGPGQANGLAFSVNPGVQLPPSLRNIYQELVNDIKCPYPTSGDLTPWTKQGVLLLNTSLTVYEHQANSHADWGWHEFTKSVFQTALTLPQPIVFILWGTKAQQFVADLDITKYPNKRVLVSTHPSPFSANRGSYTCPPFIGSCPFTNANNLLTAMGSTPIDWRLP